MNKVIIMGRLTRDPEVRYTQSGKAVATFTLAVDRRGRRNADASQPTADFIPCVAWERLAEFCGNYLVKGRQVLVEGRLQVRQYDAQDGSKRTMTEVIADNIEFAGGSRQDNGSGVGGAAPMGGGFQAPSPAAAPQSTAPAAGAAFFGSQVPNDEEVPF